MEYKIGDAGKFPFAMRKIINDIQDVDFEYVSKAVHGTCPKCNFKIESNRTVRIVKLLSIDNSKHYIGYGDNGYTLRLFKKDIPEEYLKKEI